MPFLSFLPCLRVQHMGAPAHAHRRTHTSVSGSPGPRCQHGLVGCAGLGVSAATPKAGGQAPGPLGPCSDVRSPPRTGPPLVPQGRSRPPDLQSGNKLRPWAPRLAFARCHPHPFRALADGRGRRVRVQGGGGSAGGAGGDGRGRVCPAAPLPTRAAGEAGQVQPEEPRGRRPQSPPLALRAEGQGQSGSRNGEPALIETGCGGLAPGSGFCLAPRWATGRPAGISCRGGGSRTGPVSSASLEAAPALPHTALPGGGVSRLGCLLRPRALCPGVRGRGGPTVPRPSPGPAAAALTEGTGRGAAGGAPPGLPGPPHHSPGSAGPRPPC